MNKKLGIILLFAIILPSCSYIYKVKVIGDNTLYPQFILKKPMWVSPVGRSVPLTDFYVLEKEGGEWNNRSPIWRIQIKPSVERRVSKIYYGKTPDGYEEIVKSQDLIANKPYMAVCFGRGGGIGGGIVFMIIKDRDIYKIATKKEGEEVWETDFKE